MAAGAEAAEESMSVAALVMPVPNSSGQSPEAEAVGTAVEEKDAATKGTVVVGDSEEDGEDVYKVERILDMKCEGSKNLYKVQWKGYTSDDDTWEPEVHLEDCKKVLLEFRKKVAENKAKAVRKDIQRLSLNNDIFEADSDRGQQSDTKEDTSPKKKKKNRICEVKEELKDSKKPKKDELKETKELKRAKRAEIRNLKIKIKEDVKDNRKTKKERYIESPLESESSNDSFILEDDSEDFSDNKEENQNVRTVRDKAAQGTVQEGIFEKHLDDLISIEEDAGTRVRRKKKKPRKFEEPKEIKKFENTNTFLERKTIPKKQRNQDKGRSNLELNKLPSPVFAQTLKSSRQQ